MHGAAHDGCERPVRLGCGCLVAGGYASTIPLTNESGCEGVQWNVPQLGLDVTVDCVRVGFTGSRSDVGATGEPGIAPVSESDLPGGEIVPESAIRSVRTLAMNASASDLRLYVVGAFRRSPLIGSVYRACHRPDGSFRTLPKPPPMPQILDRIGHAVGTTWSIVPTGCRYCWSG